MSANENVRHDGLVAIDIIAHTGHVGDVDLEVWKGASCGEDELLKRGRHAFKLHLTEPEPQALLEALSEVIPFARKRPCHEHFNTDVGKMYSWMHVATRTTKVYDNVAMRPRPTFRAAPTNAPPGLSAAPSTRRSHDASADAPPRGIPV